jgi:hypothetical protein
VRHGLPTLLLVLGLASCVSSEVEQQVRDQAAASAADERDWPYLSPAQKSTSIHDSARGWATLNYALNGVPIPAAYASPTSAATTKASTSK